MIVRAAIFDLDGVLADTARSHFLAWKRLADDIGVYFDEQINERLKGVSRMASLDVILEQSQKVYSAEAKDQFAAQKNEYYKELIQQVTPEDLLPGARECLVNMRDRRIKTGLASASKNAMALIKYLEISDLIDYVADANYITHHKPHPEVFLKAAKGIGVAPEYCIAFEDAIAGVAAINAANMYSIGIGDPETLSDAVVIFDDLSKFSIDKLPDIY